MTGDEGLRLLTPAWLLLLPLVWGLLWFYAKRYREQSGWRRWCEAHLLAHLEIADGGGAGRRGMVSILAVVMTLAILAAAGPSWRQQPQAVIETVAARVLVLELSRSMLVEDVRPNRFARVLVAARELLDTGFDGETGLVVYAGAAFVVSPLTSDRKTLLAFLDALNPDTMPIDGARVDHAINAAQALLDASMAGRGQILVFTDGIDDVDAAARAVLMATARGHRVSLLAVGTPEGGPLQDLAGNLLRDGAGRFRLATTDYAGLQSIARLGNGEMIRLDSAIAAADPGLFAPVAQPLLQRAAPGESSAQNAVNDGYWLIWLMLPLTLLLFRRNLFWVLLLGCWLPAQDGAYAAGWDDYMQAAERRAYAAWQREDYQAAFDLSRDPMLRGSACYRLGRYACAVEHFAQRDSALALYNLGNAQAQQQQFADAIVAYAQALELDPQFDEALVNRTLLETFLRQQADAAAAQAEDVAAAALQPETSALGNAQARIGVAGQPSTNPGDDPHRGAGLGASAQGGSLDPEDPYAGGEQGLEEYILRAAGDREPPDPAMIERWLQSLPESSSELFRRKFLRDYQRQTRQQR